MEFLRSLLRHRFARAQLATSQNVGCFLRLVFAVIDATLGLVYNMLQLEKFKILFEIFYLTAEKNTSVGTASHMQQIL